MKRKIYIISLNFLALFFITNYCIKTNFIDRGVDTSTISSMIFNTMTDVDNYINQKYSSYSNYSLTTYHNYGLLSTFNVNQTTLGSNYNGLINKHDLNGDKIIDSNDNLNLSEGICQPTAVTMALRYMVLRGDLSYTPKLNNNTLDEQNIFYDVVSAYIKNNWKGGGAKRETCYKSINTYFKNLNLKFNAKYYTKNILKYIDLSYENQIPAVGHIKGDDHLMQLQLQDIIQKL